MLACNINNVRTESRRALEAQDGGEIHERVELWIGRFETDVSEDIRLGLCVEKMEPGVSFENDY